MADDNYNTSQSNLNTAAPDGQQQQLRTTTTTTTTGRQMQPQQPVVDEMSQDLNYLSREAPLDGGESTFGAATSYSQLAGSQREESVLHMGSDIQDEGAVIYGHRQLVDSPQLQMQDNLEEAAALMAANSQRSAEQVEQLLPDNVDIQRPLQQSG